LVKGSFSGKITNAKTNSPLAGASIYLSDARMGTTTDLNGEFTLKNIPEGRHLIEISHIGFSSLVESVDIYGSIKKDFQLTESVVENNAVIVTGVTKATQLKKVPFQVSILKKEDLIQTVASNIIEALTKKPGIASIATGPAISKPVIRGLGYNRVLTINDGVRQEGQQWGDEHGIEIDEASVNKIEILKGPASIIYGSDAMAGVINIITNVPVTNNTLKANISSNYQSNNRLQSLHLSIGSNKNGINWNFYNSNKKARDYQNQYDDYVFNSKFKENNVGGYLGYNGNWGYSHLLLSKFDLTAGMVEGERDEEGYFLKNISGGNTTRATETDFKSYSPTQPYQNIQHFKIASDNSFRIGKNRLNLNIGWQRNQRAEFSNPDNLEEKALYFDLKSITNTLQFHFKEINGWKTTFGTNAMHQQNSNKGVEQLIPDYILTDMGAFIYTQKDLNEKMSLSGGARFDNRNIDSKDLMDGNTIKGNAFKKSFSNFSGTAGLTAALTNEINLKINVARAFRAPSIPELASNGNHEGTNRYEYGNLNLKSETSFQLDGGFEFNTDHMSFGLSTFYNGFSNFIFTENYKQQRVETAW
jgi:iron complex outermembrane receptor protein